MAFFSKIHQRKLIIYLQFLMHVLMKSFSHVDICTLNHDTLLEQYLEKNLVDKKIEVVDGFGQSIK